MQTVRTVTTFVSDQKEDLKEFGMGIVLKGQYLATCYHLIAKEGYKFSTIQLIYNERHVGEKFLYDSMFLIKDFEPTKDQYDFSKHVFDRNDRSTDFIILKLPEKLPVIDHKFALAQPKFLDTIYSYGNVIQGNFVNPGMQSALYVLRYNEPLHPDVSYFAYKAIYTHGFSGTPLYDTHGEILGMVQFSIDDNHEEFFNKLYKSGNISENLYNEIVIAYKAGQRVQFTIDFKFLKEKYLKGYL